MFHMPTAASLAVIALVQPTPGGAERKTCRAADGVPIVYSVAGSGGPALVFVHGGFANRGFWDEQIKAFSARHRVVALDLPGHGDSGAERKKWGMPEFGDDVRAVVESEGLEKVVLFGNSLGGPVAVERPCGFPARSWASSVSTPSRSCSSSPSNTHDTGPRPSGATTPGA